MLQLDRPMSTAVSLSPLRTALEAAITAVHEGADRAVFKQAVMSDAGEC